MAKSKSKTAAKKSSPARAIKPKSPPAAKKSPVKVAAKVSKPANKAPKVQPVGSDSSRLIEPQKMKSRKESKKARLEPVRSEPLPPPVPTDAKPRKNQAGLNSRDLEHFRQLLLLKRRELVGDMTSNEREALRSTSGSNLSNLPMHMADMGTDNYEQEFTLGLVEKERVLLREINSALAKIQDGTYGICEGTGKAIAKPRLEAKPWARHSIEYARKIENGMVR